MSKFRCGVIGCGGLGKAHATNFSRRDDVELVALCDIELDRIKQNIETNQGKASELDVSKYNLYTDAKEMLTKENLDLVAIALPTYLHAEYTIMALDMGVHVLCEKPMARTPEECQAMIDAAKRNNKMLTIGHCTRYRLSHRMIKEAYDSGKYGKLLRLELSRYSLTPVWGWENWFMDFDKSGGCALDLHIHDVDFVNYMLGRPKAVRSDAIHTKCGFDTITTQFYYEDGPIVHVNGDWSLPASYGFECQFMAVFEKAVITNGSKGVKVCPHDGEAEEFEFPKGSPNPIYMEELDYMLTCIKEGRPNDIVPMESTKQSVEMVFAEYESAKTGEIVKM